MVSAALFILAGTVLPQQVTMNVIRRVFLIKYNNHVATSFTIDVDNRQYLITARHVVDGIKDGGEVQLFRDGAWQTLKVKPLYIKPEEVDIVVLVPPQQLSPSFPLEPSMGNMVLSQDVYFLGFPYGLLMDGKALNDGFPFPFVKRGICSALWLAPTKNHNVIFIDGYNNPGFSGGPIVFTDTKTKALKVAGVVSGYRVQEDSVLKQKADTGLVVRNNSGLLVGYDIKSAVDAISQNPVGPQIRY